MTVKVTLPVRGLAAESVAVTVTTYEPAVFAATVPVINPLDSMSVKPAGNTPAVNA